MKRWVSMLIPMLALTFALVGGSGCAKKQVTRLEPDTQTDLSGEWNDTDSRLVADELIGSSMSGAWLLNFLRDEGRNPAVIAGSIKNRSHEHINTRTFLKDIQRAFIMSGSVDVVADATERSEVRDERLEQLEHASPETVKRLGMELGADFMLHGEINTIPDEEGGTRVMYYQVDLQLVNIETGQIVWLDTKKIKKAITKGRYKA